MITLKDLFDDLATGELSNMYVVVDDEIVTTAYKKIITVMNRALGEIYSRFNLLQKKWNIHQQVGVTDYYIRESYVSDIDMLDVDGYIEEKDDELFENDLIKLAAAYNVDDLDTPLPINDNKYPDTGLFTLAPDHIQMVPTAGTVITIVYQARYPKIVYKADIDPTRIKLYIPDFILPAVYAYIASKLLQGKASSATEGEKHTAATFMAKFEYACALIKQQDLDMDVNDTKTSFTAGGWV